MGGQVVHGPDGSRASRTTWFKIASPTGGSLPQREALPVKSFRVYLLKAHVSLME